MSYDPIILTRIVEKKVCEQRNNTPFRRYYRFRGGRWYGGCAAADCIGCNLRCRFCWSWSRGSYQLSGGYLCSPEEVYRRLYSIAIERKYKYVRISGGEPTLCKEHLLRVIERFENTKINFILETNGVLIGYDDDYARTLARFKKLIVRVSLKGTCPEEFHKLTGAIPEAFNYQLKAIEKLVSYGMTPGEQVYPAVMLSFSDEENIEKLLDKLRNIHPVLAEAIDPEYVILYPHVVQLLKKFNLKPRIAYTPNNIPKFMI